VKFYLLLKRRGPCGGGDATFDSLPAAMTPRRPIRNGGQHGGHRRNGLPTSALG